MAMSLYVWVAYGGFSMATIVGVVESDGGMLEKSIIRTTSPSFSSEKQIGNPVAYKLVRVEGDGKLVPATDEEIMEVKDLLEKTKNDMHIVTDAGQTLGFISDGGLSSGLPHRKSSEGLSQSANREPDADKLDPWHEEPIPFSKKDKKRCSILQPKKMGRCSRPTGSSKEAAVSTAAQKPDFSKLRGEICLDNLSIKELQETFRATFGRETTVKDKLWLKRRIAMGLMNSCVVSTTSFTIKDNKVVGQEENNKNVSHAFGEDIIDEVRADNCKDATTGPSDHRKGHHGAYDNRPRDNFMDNACGGEDFAGELRAAKRARKPTRRYIEELLETDDKQQSGKSMSPSKEWRLTPKAQLRPIRAISSGGRVVITRMFSLAGSKIEVPFVSQVRRSRPRVNVMALVDFHHNHLEPKATPEKNSQSLAPSRLNNDKAGRSLIKSASKMTHQEFAIADISQNGKRYSRSIPIEVDQEPKHVDSFGNSSGNSHSSTPIQKVALRRKHHRAWTLSEVIKLVEGVSKYGAGRWSEIRRLSFASHSYRTSVDLKDKWRNLLKASFAQTPPDRRGSFRNHGASSIPIPTQILSRVRELAEKQSQVPRVKDGSRMVQEGRSGFL